LSILPRNLLFNFLLYHVRQTDRQTDNADYNTSQTRRYIESDGYNYNIKNSNSVSASDRHLSNTGHCRHWASCSHTMCLCSPKAV